MKLKVSVEFDFEVDLDERRIWYLEYRQPPKEVTLPKDMEDDVFTEAEEALGYIEADTEDFDRKRDERIDDEMVAPV